VTTPVQVKKLAYLRKENEIYEIDYPLDKIWEAIPKVISNLKWMLVNVNSNTNHVEAKTKSGLMSYSSVLLISAVPLGPSTTKVTVKAETPVTTITALADFGRTQRRIFLFFEELSKELTSENCTA